LLVNLDLTLPTLGPEPGDETPRMMPLAIDRGMSVRYSGLRLRGVTDSSRMTGPEGSRAWTGSWTGAPDNPSVVSGVSAMIRVIYAASTHKCRKPPSTKRL